MVARTKEALGERDVEFLLARSCCDLSWMTLGDVLTRLYRARQLLRRLIGIVYREPVILDWSSPAAPYHGVMIHQEPKTILINPEPLLSEYPWSRAAEVVGALYGVALHEASHAMWTPWEWGEALTQAREDHERQTGVSLPTSLLMTVANWIEDRFVEHRLFTTFQGFHDYLTTARAFFLPDPRCHEIVVRAQACGPPRKAQHQPRQAAEARARVATLVGLLSVAVNRPDFVLDAETQAQFSPLLAAAREIHAIDGETPLQERLATAVRITAALRTFLGAAPDPPQADRGGGGSAARARRRAGSKSTASRRAQTVRAAVQRAARLIDQALRGHRSLLRDDAMPLEAQPVARPLSSAEVEALTALEKGKAEFHAVGGIVASTNGLALQGKTLRIVDSAPETLYGWHPRYADAAEEIFAAHRRVAEALRQHLQWREQPRTFRECGQTAGDELDQAALHRVLLGSPAIFARHEELPAPGLSLVMLLDESGSMATGERWRWSAAAALCVEYALRVSQHSRLRVYGYTSDAFTRGETVLYRHFDSAVPRLRRPQALGWVYPKASNADGIALAGLRRLLQAEPRGNETLRLLMISDGQPSGEGYGGRPAYQHVAGEVRQLLKAGCHFAHLQIGQEATDEALTQMYGQRWLRLTHVEALPTTVVALMRRWLRPRS